ncbi:FAD-dependent oxidoreductase, partial [Patescibacteria group bacterium]|nr:FAD-dependent oxidoreductase [Patescibacteria group bacterium]
GVEIKSDEVKKIENKDNKFVLHTSRDIYEARTVILAMGLSPRRLAIPGEEKLTGKGVSYCANCDGPFYKNKTAAVVGGGNSALDAAEILSKIAKKVYLIHRRDEFRGFEALVDEVKARKNIELVLNSEPREVIGENKLEKIKVFNNKTKEEKDLEIDGLFVEIGRIANTDLVADLAKRNERGEIIVDEKCMTSCPGMFAAGDVTPVEFKQITIACGQGAIAALAAYQYLRLKQGESGEVVDRSYMKK